MDYKNFLDNYNTYNEWNRIVKREAEEEKKLCEQDLAFDSMSDTISFGNAASNPYPPLSAVPNDPFCSPSVSDSISFSIDDRVNSPSHYTKGKQEVIDIIEDAINDAPSMPAAMSQGQVLKYMLRCWLKDNPLEDLKKARWYLNRLINHLEGEG